MDAIVKQKGNKETKKLATTIEKGEEFNKEFYHWITEMEIKLLELKNDLEDWAKMDGTHMTHSVWEYT